MAPVRRWCCLVNRSERKAALSAKRVHLICGWGRHHLPSAARKSMSLFSRPAPEPLPLRSKHGVQAAGAAAPAADEGWTIKAADGAHLAAPGCLAPDQMARVCLLILVHGILLTMNNVFSQVTSAEGTELPVRVVQGSAESSVAKEYTLKLD